MKPVSVAVQIDAPPAAVWTVITNIEDAARTISAIEQVEVLERPEHGIRGLKWRETRTVLGKQATETMWITEVEEGSSYATEARSHGSIYRTRLEVAEANGGARLMMRFSAQPTTLAARLMALVFGPLVARSVRNALRQDLEDIRQAAEARPGAPAR
jgi:uncharacterized membrane protein